MPTSREQQLQKRIRRCKLLISTLQNIDSRIRNAKTILDRRQSELKTAQDNLHRAESVLSELQTLASDVPGNWERAEANRDHFIELLTQHRLDNLIADLACKSDKIPGDVKLKLKQLAEGA